MGPRGGALFLALTLVTLPAVTFAVEPVPEPVEVLVMTLNVFYGGDELDLTTGDWCAEANGCVETLDHVVEAIEASGADIVGLEEAEGNTELIAERLGWYASPRTQVVSRYPLLDAPDGSDLVYAEVTPGAVIAIANVHLPATPEGPYLVRDGGGPDELMALEQETRVPPLEARLGGWSDAVEDGIPVIVAGDFNTPSHLDWTEAVAAVRPEVRYPFEWPVSRMLASAGFRDTWRVAWPDPVERAGFTWTPGGPESVEDEVHDRIDWVLAAGDVEVIGARLVGESAYEDVDVAVDPWPTDHRGVVADLLVQPASLDRFIAVEPRHVAPGEQVMGRVIDVSGTARSVGLVDEEGNLVEQRALDDAVAFPTDRLAPGTYALALHDASGSVLAEAPFWVDDPSAQATISAAEPSYAAGEPIEVTWSGAPGMRWDWIGVVPVDADPGDYLGYEYTDTLPAGSVSLGPDASWNEGAWPLAAGEYRLMLLLDDGYTVLAESTPFEVTAAT